VTDAAPAVLCVECRRELEDCGFCGEHCGHEVCYRCALVMLKETLPQPHGHGG
jgi:hypothetical protein